jgi:putative heme-binding domain-containing protein
MQRELEILEVMTANRDRGVWAVAAGSDLAVDDSNTPPHVPVQTNKPGPLPGGKHVFVSGAAAIENLTLAKGIKVELFASEEMFPELVNPVQMAFDTQGRLWVAAWDSYPHWKPGDELNDKLLVLEDTDGDGRADRCLTFADHLHNPTGFEFWGGGVFVAMAPDLLFLRDLDGDGKADTRERVLSGLDSADTHHTSNSFTFDPGGALYFQEGTFHHSQVETPYGPPVRLANAGVFRYEPRAQKFDVYVSYGFANPHGHAFDYWGQDIVVDGTGANPYHAALFSGHVDFPAKHSAPPQVYKPRTRPCPAIEYLSSQHFPESMRENLLVANVIGFQGILQYRVSDRGASLTAEEVEPLLSSSDPSFRPADMEIGPDGSLYFTDWHNPIIGHMQHNLRDPSRDRTHGRVYRVTYAGRPLVKPAKIAGQPINELLDLLHDPDGRVRYRAKIELSARPTNEVVAALSAWVAHLDKNNPRHEHDLLEALWVYQHHNQVNVPLLERMLGSRDFRARAAAARVLCYWRDRVPDALARFKTLAGDEHPRVRLEALRAASFFPQADAVEVVAITEQKPLDEYLTYVRGETLKTLGPAWDKALASASEVQMTTDAGRRYWLRHIGSEQLVKQPRTADVCREMLLRAGLLDEVRKQATRRLAELEHESELQVVLQALRTLDARDEAAQSSVVFDLVRQLVSADASQLAAGRAELEKLATDARQPVVRQIGFVSLVGIDGSADRAWTLAAGSVQGLDDFLAAVPMLADPATRAALYDQVAPLLDGLPQSLASAKPAALPAARYVRIELPRAGTLTLAEVEVISGGHNVAGAGKAKQKNTANGGDANRAIDGNASGAFADGGQTHTEENTARPWWELDLKSPVAVEQVVIHNRTDGYLGRRLDGFTLELLDADRQSVYKREKIEAPRDKAVLAIGQANPAVAVRHAAMAALASMRGHERAAFQAIAPFLKNDVDRAAAISALQRITRSEWPKDTAAELLADMTTWLGSLPAVERTSPAALASLEFADAVAGLLPAADARRARGQLAELGVRVVRVGTLFERMTYDVDMIAVRAGRPVEFVFENSDLMPHNFVIVAPGSLEQIGMLAERTAQDPGAAERHYVPAASQVLLASTLLQPRGVEKLSFTAPKTPGVYPYVCTYPGHWRRMFGALYVVDDLDAYLDNPERYLASHPLEIKDELLKDRRPRTEWTLDSLAGPVGALDGGRSYARGKHLFQVANCVACHKMDGAGNAIGPELAKLDEKMMAVDVLKELLDPSARINEKYQTFAFELNSGKIVTGLVLEETPDGVRVIEDPLAKKEPIELAKSDIAERHASKTSLMPKGLLDKLSREEILDLIAYVVARGNPQAPIVSGSDHEHH